MGTQPAPDGAGAGRGELLGILLSFEREVPPRPPVSPALTPPPRPILVAGPGRARPGRARRVLCALPSGPATPGHHYPLGPRSPRSHLRGHRGEARGWAGPRQPSPLPPGVRPARGGSAGAGGHCSQHLQTARAALARAGLGAGGRSGRGRRAACPATTG